MGSEYDYELEARKQQPTLAHTVSLGHNFQPISTMYEPYHKTRDGRTFEELLDDFAAPFPPESHKFYEIGYSKEFQSKLDYVYLPWEEYEEALNRIVGRGRWLIETIGSWIDESGKPVLRMRLRVLDVVFEANGYAKPRGDWKGSLTEIAEKDGLKECCERLCGMGRYLKDQFKTIEYIYHNTTDQTLKGEMRRLAGQRKKSLGAQAMNQRQATKPKENTDLIGAMSDPFEERRAAPVNKPQTRSQQSTKQQQPAPPKTQEQPTAAASVPPSSEIERMAKGSAARPELYPQNNGMIKTARTKSGVSQAWLIGYLDSECNGLRPAMMTTAELNPVLRAMAIEGYQNRFQNRAAAASSYDAKIAVMAGGNQAISHFQAFCLWCGEASALAEVRSLSAASSAHVSEIQEP